MKKLFVALIPVTFLFVAPVETLIAGEEGNWKRGRIYYRMVCTSCHKEMAGKSISPVSKTIAEWKKYVELDKHDSSGKSNASLKYYTSQAYRESIKDIRWQPSSSRFRMMPCWQMCMLSSFMVPKIPIHRHAVSSRRPAAPGVNRVQCM